MRKYWLSGLVAALLLGLSACGGGGSNDAGDAPSDDSSSESAPADEGAEEGGAEGAAPEPDLEGVPDVVAEVNGEEVTKDEFTQAYESQFQQMSMQSQGQPVDQDQLKKQVADNLVGTELLRQESEARDFTATDDDVQKSLTELAKQNGLKSPDEFLKALEGQGLDQETVEAQVADQVLIDQLIADEAGDTQPTDKQVRALYDSAVKQQEQAGQEGGQKIPPLAKVRPQIVEQLKSEEESKVAETLVTSLREDADVTINL